MAHNKLLAYVFSFFLFATPALSQSGQNSHDQAALDFLKAVGMDRIVGQVSTALVLAFSEPELREIITFYETATGRKMAAQLPQLMEGAAAAGGRLAGAHIPDLQRMLQERNQPPQVPWAFLVSR
jgi:hypothetical protein